MSVDLECEDGSVPSDLQGTDTPPPVRPPGPKESYLTSANASPEVTEATVKSGHHFEFHFPKSVTRHIHYVVTIIQTKPTVRKAAECDPEVLPMHLSKSRKQI